MSRVLDADTHIAEPPEMWGFLHPDWHKRRPVVVQVPEDTLYGGVDHMWLIDGQIYPRPAGRGGNFLVTPTEQKNVRDRVDRKARELLDLPMRFEDMQATQVDTQVVYPTLFLAYLTPRRRIRGRAVQGIQPLPCGRVGEGGRPHPVRRYSPAP